MNNNITKCQNSFTVSGLSADLLLHLAGRVNLGKGVIARLAIQQACDYFESVDDLGDAWREKILNYGEGFGDELGRRNMSVYMTAPLFRRVNGLTDALDIKAGEFLDMSFRIFSDACESNGGVFFPDVKEDLITINVDTFERAGVQLMYEHKRNLGVLAEKWGVTQSNVLRMVLDGFFGDLKLGKLYKKEIGGNCQAR